MTKITKSPLKHEGIHSPYADEIAYHKAQGGVHNGVDYGEGTVYKRKSKEEQEKIDKNIEEQKVKEQEEVETTEVETTEEETPESKRNKLLEEHLKTHKPGYDLAWGGDVTHEERDAYNNKLAVLEKQIEWGKNIGSGEGNEDDFRLMQIEDQKRTWKDDQKELKNEEGYVPKMTIFNEGSQEFEDVEVEVDENGFPIIPDDWNMEDASYFDMGEGLVYTVKDPVANSIRLKNEKEEEELRKQENIKLNEEAKEEQRKIKEHSDKTWDVFQSRLNGTMQWRTEDYEQGDFEALDISKEDQELIKKYIYDYEFNDGREGRAWADIRSPEKVKNLLNLIHERQSLLDEIESINPDAYALKESQQRLLGVSQASIDRLKEDLEEEKSKQKEKQEHEEKIPEYQEQFDNYEISKQEFENLKNHNQRWDPHLHYLAVSSGGVEGAYAWNQEGVDATNDPELQKMKENWEDPQKEYWENRKKDMDQGGVDHFYTGPSGLNLDERFTSGTLDFESFMSLTDELVGQKGFFGTEGASNTPQFIANKLNEVSDDLEEKYDNYDYHQMWGQGDIGSLYEGITMPGNIYRGRDYTYRFEADGEQLVMNRYKKVGYNEIELYSQKTLDLPVQGGDDPDKMWSDVYAEYVAFLNFQDERYDHKEDEEILNTVVGGWNSWVGDVTEDALEYGDKFVDEDGRVDVTAYIEHIEPNTEKIYLKENILLDFEKRPYVAKGDRRGNIQLAHNTHRYRRPGGHAGFDYSESVFTLRPDHPDYKTKEDQVELYGDWENDGTIKNKEDCESKSYMNPAYYEGGQQTTAEGGMQYEWVKGVGCRGRSVTIGLPESLDWQDKTDKYGLLTFTRTIAGTERTYRYDPNTGFNPEVHLDEWLKMKTMHADWTRKEHILEDVLDREYNRLYNEDLNTTTVMINGVEKEIISGGGEIAAGTKAHEFKTEEDYEAHLKKLEKEVDAIPETVDLKGFEGGVTYKDQIEYQHKEETEYFNNVILPEMEEKWKEKQAEFEEQYDVEYAEKIKPHIETIESTLEAEFEDQVEELNKKSDNLQNKFLKENDLKASQIADEVEEQLLEDIKNGSFDPQSNEEFLNEWRKRSNEIYNTWQNSQLKDRQSQLDAIWKPYNEQYKKRFLEEEDKVMGEWKDEKYEEINKIYTEFQDEFVEKAYETKRGRVQLIPEEIYKQVFTDLTDNEGFKFHNLGWKGQVASINLAWSALEQQFDAAGMSEEDVDARREEFYHKAYGHISVDQKGRPTATAMKMWSNEVIALLEDEEDLTKAQKEQLYYAKRIMKSPEFMKDSKVAQFFDGMVDAFNRGEWIPLLSDYSTARHQNYVNNLLKKEKLHTDDPENNPPLTVDERQALVFYTEESQMQGRLREGNSVYNAGGGTVSSLKFMVEMVATRGLGKIVGRSSNLLVRGKGKLALTSQKTLDRYIKMKGGLPTSGFKIQDKAANIVEHLMVTTTMASVGGSMNIYKGYEQNLTPEMSWSLTEEAGQMVIDIDNLGFAVADADGNMPGDENWTPTYDETKDGWEAFWDSYKHNFVEFATERFGELLPGGKKFLRKKLKDNPTWAKRMFLGNWARKSGLNPADPNILQKFMKAGGWNGIVPEILEEMVGQPAHNWIDGKRWNDGMDRQFFEEVTIQVGAMQTMFGLGGTTYNFIQNRKGDNPVYNVGMDSYSNPKDAVEAVKFAKENGQLKDLKIEISNDYYAFEEVANLLKGTEFENNLTSKNLVEIIDDVRTGMETEAINILDKESVEEVEKITEKIENLDKKIENKKKGPVKDKEQTLKEIDELRREKHILENDKQEIINPVIESINKERNTEAYEQKLQNVKKHAEEVDPGLNIIENESSIEAAEIYKEKATNDILDQYGVETMKDAKTGRQIYVDKKNNYTLSKKDLNERGIDIDKLNQDVDKMSQDFGSVHGFITPEIDGQSNIIINKEAALKVDGGNANVAVHEFLHRFLNKTFNKNPHTKLAVGKALEQQLMNMNPRGIRNSRFKKRLEDYQAGDKINSAEETLTLFSDALASGEIVYNETNFTKMGDMFRRAFSLAGKKVEFNTGRDVMNFVRDYNRAMEKGKMSRGMKRTMKKGARIGGFIKYGSSQYADSLKKLGYKQDTEGRFPMFSKEASDKVQSIYEEQGVAGAFDIIDEFKPITGKIVERRRDVPGFDRQLLMDEIETGARGIFDLIQSYNPDSGVPLAAYINKYLPSRAIEASNRILGEQFTEDITERVDIAEEAAPVEIFDQVTGKKIKLSERLGPKAVAINKEVKSIAAGMDVSELTFKTLKDLTPDMTQDMFGIIPKPGNLTKGDIKNAQMFINKHAATLIQMLPEGSTVGGTSTGVQKVLLNAFYTKSDRAKMAKTGTKAGLAIQVKNPNIETKQFLEVFGITERGKENTYKKDSNTSSRIKALVSQTGKMLSNQGVREHLLEREKSLDAIQRIADGKSRIMFSNEFTGEKTSINLKDGITPENFRAVYESKIGELGEAIHGRNVRIPNKQVKRTKSDGTIETYSIRDLDAVYNKETGETFGEAAARVANTFLESNPEHHTLLSNTMTGGEKAGLFNTKGNFNSKVGKAEGKQVDIKRFSYNKKKKFLPSVFEKIKTAAFKKDREARLPELLKFFEAIQGHLQNFPEDVWFFEEMLLDTGKQQNTVTRILAPFSFYTINTKTGKPIFDQKAVEEHTDPQNLIGKQLLAGAFFNKLDDVWKVVGKSYMQGSLLEIDDPSGALKSNMPDVYYEQVVPRLLSGELKLPNGYSSLVRLAVSGVDPNSIFLIETNNTIAEFFGVTNMPVETANDLIIKQLTGEIDARYVTEFSKVADKIPAKSEINKSFMFSKAIDNTRLINHKTPSRGMSAFDFDETLIDKGENTIIAKKGDDVVTITSGQWPIQGPQLAKAGYEFDFSDFINVRGGVEGPLMQKFRNRIDKYGIENNYILTARPAESAPAIQAWLKQQGIDMPIENITGLGNSTGEAKAMWIANKFAEGYNDIYFVDDALPNVKAVADILDQLDIKGSSVQARIKFSKDMNTKFNDILEQTTGVESQKQFSEAQAKLRGKKGRYKSLIPASAQDFMGLLYNFMAKGKVGEQQMEFFKKALVDPFARGINELNAAKQTSFNDLNNLFKQFKGLKKKLRKKVKGTNFTTDHAVRVYLWTKVGFDTPGLSKRDTKTLVDYVNNNSELKAFADALGIISKKEQGYSKPGEFWLAENIQSDLLSDGALGDARSSYLAEWQQNVDEIFSPKNLNKIQAIYGAKFTEALKDILYRMKTGSNRPTGSNRLTNMYMNWVNNSVGAIMFFNIRSAALQTISAVNYVNWTDNNPLKAGLALANQPRFWKDFVYLFNSDFLKQRRKGNQRGVNEAELMNAVVGSSNPAKAAIAWLLNKGFLPTQIADSFAIASGGATFYRNRVNKYKKQGMDQKAAEEQAFLDFQETTEVSQQSARPDLISQQQANPLGRLILAFQNTPMQYGRIMNKAIRDLVNRRGDTKTHLSKIVYYGAVQAVIFNALQSAIWASLADEDDEEIDKKKFRILNGMLDGWLSAFGYGGKAVSTGIGTVQEYLKQKDKGWNADHTYTILKLLSFSPPIGSKARKIYSSIQTEKFNEEVMKKRGLTLDNPIWSAVGNVIEGVTNIPLGRLANKMKNLDNAMDSNLEWWKRVALLSGWNTWDLGIKDADLETLKLEIKEIKKQEKEIEREEKKKEKKKKEEKKEKDQEEVNKELQKQEKKEGKKVLCAAISKKGTRCKNEILPGQTYCTIHEKVEQNESGEKKQCKKIKSDKKRCKMKTSSKSGYCYYHD